MKIVALVSPNNAVDYHRIILPIEHMPWKLGDQAIVMENDKPFSTRILEGADIVWYSRVCPFNLEKILDGRDKYGYKILADVDDYWFLYENHHLINRWLADETSKKMIRTMEIADFIFCTNEKLRSRIHIINENVQIIKNALPYGEGQFQEGKPYDGGLIKFIYVGGVSHLHDLRILEPTVNACSKNKRISKESMLKLGGYSNTRTWNRMRTLVEQYGNHGFVSNLPINRYMEAYDEGDICIAPLQNNEFNTYKSTLKIVEAGCKKRPIICSNMLPYSEDSDCEGVILCKNARDWYNAIESFILYPSQIKELGEELYKYVFRKYNLHTENRKRYLYFKQIAAL